CLGLPVVGSDLPDVVDDVPGVVVSTLAGSDMLGVADGSGAAAAFDNPANLLLVEPDTLYVADFDNGRVRVSTTDGDVSTLTNQVGFARPFGLAWTTSGDLVVETDFDENGLNAGPNGGTLWTVDAVSGVATPLVTMAGRPRGLVTLAGGMIAATDIVRHDVRLLDPSTGAMTPLAGLDACPGYVDAAGAAARFNRPYGSVVTPAGDLLVADQYNHVIRQIAPSGDVTTFAGDGVPDMIDGAIASARFNLPQDLAIDAAGNVYVADTGNHRIRVIGVDGFVRTLAGDGVAGFADGAGASARFFGMEGVEVAADGKTLYVADGTNGDPEPYHRLRKITVP
ncbi:MAG TPA: hypothetical protein VL400_26805, partial [Polyangiaceae bacterium]|nr:hypothetical protein [Polyangiaceae bacterium]